MSRLIVVTFHKWLLFLYCKCYIIWFWEILIKTWPEYEVSVLHVLTAAAAAEYFIKYKVLWKCCPLWWRAQTAISVHQCISFYFSIVRLFIFMWKPGKTRLFSHGTACSLSPNKGWQEIPPSFCPVFRANVQWQIHVLFWGEQGAASLYAFWRTIVCFMTCDRVKSLCSDWPWFLQYLNMMMAVSWLEYQTPHLSSCNAAHWS